LQYTVVLYHISLFFFIWRPSSHFWVGWCQLSSKWERRSWYALILSLHVET
jgi:hypothetical protein